MFGKNPTFAAAIKYGNAVKMHKMKIEDLTKSNVWSLTEAELNAMLIDAKKRDVFAESERHYINIIRPVFDLQYLNRNDEARAKQLTHEHYDIFSIPVEGDNNAIAIRKRRIEKVTDLTLENISHQQPADVLKLIDRNLGTGWQGLPLPLQDIIESAFYVDCSVMPTYALHKKGGLVSRRKKDGYDVLEIERGSWTEAIFIKAKPKPSLLSAEAHSRAARSQEDADEGLAAVLAAGLDDEALAENEDGEEPLDVDDAVLDLAAAEGMDEEEPLDEDGNPEFVNIDDIDPDDMEGGL